MSVDTSSCGTGKQDRRIGNPGPYRAYLRYAFFGPEGTLMDGGKQVSSPSSSDRGWHLAGARPDTTIIREKPTGIGCTGAIFTPENNRHKEHDLCGRSSPSRAGGLGRYTPGRTGSVREIKARPALAGTKCPVTLRLSERKK